MMPFWFPSAFCQEVETRHIEGHLHCETRGRSLAPENGFDLPSKPWTTERFMLKRFFGET